MTELFTVNAMVSKERKMEHRLLGQTGLQLPVVGMGTWKTFDVRGKKAIENARAIVDAALANGGRDGTREIGWTERDFGFVALQKTSRANKICFG